ncbi:hypothetical protein [Candidatus Reidiella endopervernicosa]|nr:hypothetical protein [Candidatus Reidiella endopervernicosa]
MSVEELEKYFSWLVRELYSDEETQLRKSNFFRQLREVKRQELRVG